MLFQQLLVLTCAQFLTKVFATCYFPDGDISPADVACDPSQLDSFCCYSQQACLSNKLCLTGYVNNEAQYARGTCTDPNWESGECPNFCLDQQALGNPVFSCNQTGVDSYCCNDGCSCDAGSETLSFTGTPYTITEIGIAATFPNPSATASASASATSQTSSSTTSSGSSSSSASGSSSSGTSSSAPTATAAAATASSSSSASGTSSATAIGVGVGVGVGAAIVLIALGFFFLRHRRNKRKTAVSDISDKQSTQGLPGYYPPHDQQDSAYHAAAPKPAPELAGGYPQHQNGYPQTNHLHEAPAQQVNELGAGNERRANTAELPS